jgi:hypothetical protein
MNRMILPPYEPKHSQPVRAPMIYVKQAPGWEYKPIVRNLKDEGSLDEAALNKLGEEGWEMTGIAQQPPLAFFYFKRVIEK